MPTPSPYPSPTPSPYPSPTPSPFPSPAPSPFPPPSSPVPPPSPSGLPPRAILTSPRPATLPDGDFVWTWGETSEDEEGAARESEEGLVVVHVEGRQGRHACELTAELVDYLGPESDRVRNMKRTLENMADAPDFATRVRSTMQAQRLSREIQGRESVVRAARLSCVVSPSEEELRARERARRAQERRRSR